MALRSAAIALAVSVLGLAWILGHVAAGLGYVALFALLLLPGLPLGFYLFGARHAAGWIAGGPDRVLSSEPVWVGWRAGQIMLVTAPPIIAVFFPHLVDASTRSLAAIAAALALAVGLPTTVIDTWNAQDVEHVSMGPGFRWTVVVPPATPAAMKWLRQRTPAEAIVQMSIGPRGRETWTLVPTFAGHRMAAGQPISLLHLSEYDQRSGAVDAMFRTTSAAEASRVAHSHRIDYVFVDGVERNAFGAAAIGKFSDPQYFEPVFEEGDAAVFQVR